jgi:tRNA(fMet)-specific endonuclease VapC
MGRIKYLLDTKILSEPALKTPNTNVMQAFAQYDDQYATAAIVWHELQFGCELLANSKRKTALQSYLLALQEGA